MSLVLQNLWLSGFIIINQLKINRYENTYLHSDRGIGTFLLQVC